MINGFLRLLLGLNFATIIRGYRFGHEDFIKTGYASLAAVHPLQNRTEKECQELLHSVPEIALNQILGDRKPEIRLKLEKPEDGIMGLQDAISLLGILVMESPQEVLEIGTYMGHTTKRMADNLRNSIIHTIDLPLDFSPSEDINSSIPKDDFHLINRRVVGREFTGQYCAKRIVQHFGDTVKMDFKAIGSPTFFFIDGSHTYDYCKQDSEKCLALCKGGETFLWHDCDAGHSDVLKFLLEWRALGKNIMKIEGTCTAYWKVPIQNAR
jgi:hypothetical protein